MTRFKNNFSVGRMQELLPQTLLLPSGPIMLPVSNGQPSQGSYVSLDVSNQLCKYKIYFFVYPDVFCYMCLEHGQSAK